MNALTRLSSIFLSLSILTACTRTPKPTDVPKPAETTPPLPTEVLRPTEQGLATIPACGVAPATNNTGQVIPIRNMTTSRAAHTATLLPNGKILITGGFDGHGQGLSSAELFDPEACIFTSTGSMSVARYAHTATLLPTGQVLIAGGYNGDYLASAELYDPATGQFSPTGQMTMARHDHTAVLLNTGEVLLVGGVGIGWTFLAAAELYDPATGTFTTTDSLAVPREANTITLLKNGQVLITGGHQGRRSAITIYSSAELYDPAMGAFSATGSLISKRHKHEATLLPDGRVLISGGADERDDQGAYTSTEIYNPETGAFAAAASMNAARYKYRGTSVLLKNGKVLLMGGASLTEIYDPAADLFSPLAQSVGATRLFAATAPLPNGDVLLAGGYGTNITASAQAWIFIP